VTVLLDSCAFLRDAAETKRLSRKAVRAIATASNDGGLLLSVISCWEVAKLVQKEKLRLALPIRDWLDRALAREGLRLVELSPEIAVESTELTGLAEGDPADRIIVATARVLNVPVVTADRRILECPGVRAV
jgi:PIN domain nuclease of toxin-antitoxin system